MDCERLISEVRRRRPIWQLSHPHHHNRGVLDKMWKEVAAKMCIPVKELRLKWKYLRDQFRKELKKVPKSCSGDEDGTVYKPTWQYYDHLMFMRYQMSSKSPSKQTTNVKIQKNDENSGEEDADTSDVNESVLSPEIAIGEEPFAEKSSLVDQRSIKAKLLKVEERKLKLLARQSCSGAEQCDDYHFFMSLLPVMKKFDDMQRMRIRSQIQQLIIDQMGVASSVLPTYASTQSSITSNYVQCQNSMLESSVSSLQSFDVKPSSILLQYPTEYKIETHNY